MTESTEDVLDLFPEDGDMFSANENDKKLTPKSKLASVNPVQISPIAFESPDPEHSEPIPIVKLGVVNKRAISSRLGEYMFLRLAEFAVQVFSVYKYSKFLFPSALRHL